MTIKTTTRTLQLTLLLAACLAATQGHAVVCRVTTAGTDTGDGSDWNTQAMDPHTALADTGCTEIWIASGVYKPHASDESVSFIVDRQVEVYGGFDGTETMLGERDPAVNLSVLSGDIDNNDTVNADGVTETAGDIAGNNSDHVVFVNGTTASGPVTTTTVIDGVIITAGQADATVFPDTTGGGLFCAGNGNNNECSPMLNRIIFSGNSATQGGGAMFNDANVAGNSSPVLNNATFSGNSSGTNGGAMYNRGVFNGISSPELNSVTFNGNTAGIDGGAMYSFGDGGVSSPTLYNVTFNGNTASGSGGAMANWGENGVSSPEVINVTFSGNSASVSGGAIYNTGIGGASELLLGNSITWGNTAPTGPEIHNNNAAPLVVYSIVQGGCPAGSTCDNNIYADPLLGPLADNGGFTQTMLPDAASPVVDAGFQFECPSEDQRGIARPQGQSPNCDLGAVELGVPRVSVAVFGNGVVDAAAIPAPIDSGIAGCDSAGQGQPYCMATYTEEDTVVLNITPAFTWQFQSAAGCDGVLSGTTYTTGPILAECTVAVIFEPVAGHIHHVDPTATGANDGSSWTDAFNDAQDAMTLAGTGQQIRVAAGVYYPTGDPSDRSASFHLIDGVEIYGGFPSGGGDFQDRDWETHVTVLSGDIGGDDVTNSDGVTETTAGIVGNNSYQVVIGSGTTDTTVLDGFFITAAYGHNISSNFQGGGLHNNHGSPALSNLNFSGNRAYAGGGLYNNNNSNPSLTNVTFSGNSAFNGGGMFNTSYHSTMTNVVFSNNQADNQGGGLRNFTSSPVMINVDFNGNQAAKEGGGLWNFDSAPSLTNSTFIDNSASDSDGVGGAMFNEFNSAPVLTDVAFIDNSAGDAGGAMYTNNQSGTNNPALNNVTFSGNQATNGGGMFNRQSSPTLFNFSFSGNVGSDAAGGMFNNEGSSPILINGIFSGNQSANGGGMVNQFSSNPSLTNVSFSGNRADNEGGAMLNNADSNPELINTVLWNNQSGGSTTSTLASIFNLDSASTPVVAWSLVANCNPGGTWNTDCGTAAGNNLADSDPLFVDTPEPANAPTTAGDLRLQAGSPAVDSGDPATDPGLFPGGPTDPVDLDNNPRFLGDAIDLGPYEVLPPLLTFDPMELDFGEVELDSGGASLSATLHNDGGDATGLDFSISGATGFSVTGGDCAAVLPAGDNCQLEVSFLPDGTGSAEGVLIADSNQGMATELALSGNGVEPGALGADPDHLDFEDVVITRTRTLSFNIINTGGAGVELASVTLESGAPAFVITGVGCAAGTVLNPGDNCPVDVSFTPQQVALHEGEVRITDEEGQPVTVNLFGTVLPDGILADRFEQSPPTIR